MVDSKALAKDIAKSASDLKALDIVVLNLTKLCSFTDYFVIVSGTSNRHVKSIADNILKGQKKKGMAAIGVEGENRGEWVLIDYGSVVAHVFYPAAREFYKIERLWGDAKRVRFKGLK